VNLSPVSGLPAIVMPAGFTRIVYDRAPGQNPVNFRSRWNSSHGR